MITKKTIQIYAFNQPLILRQNFARLIASDELTQTFLEGDLKPFVNYLQSQGLDIQDFENVESLVDVYRGRSLQIRTKNKVLQFCFKGIVASLYGSLYGIPFEKLNKQNQKLASEAIFLASLYKEIGG